MNIMKNMKKLVSIMLSLALILGCVGMVPAKAADHVMSVTGVHSFSTNGDWRFFFNVDGTWPTSGEMDAYSNKDFTVTIKDVAGNVLATPDPAAAIESYKNSDYWLLCVWGTYTGTHKPQEGDTVTISAGQMSYANDASKSVVFENECVLKWNASAGAWAVVTESVGELETVSGKLTLANAQIEGGNSGSEIYLYSYDAITPDGTWATILTPYDSNSGIWVNDTYAGGQLKKYGDGLYYAEGFGTVSEGQIVTIKGVFGNETTGEYVDMAESKFRYNGAGWEEVVDTINETGRTFSAFDGIYNNATQIGLLGNDSHPTADWTKSFVAAYGENNGIFYNGVKTYVPIKRIGNCQYFVALGDVGITAVAGDEVVMKGVFTERGYAVSYNALTLTFDGNAWVMGTQIPEEPTFTYTDITFNRFESVNTNSEMGYWDIYISTTEAVLPGTSWGTSYDDIVVLVDGKPIEVSIKKGNHASEMNFFFYATQLSLNPAVGTTLTIKAGKSLGTTGGAESDGINVVKDFVGEWNGSTWVVKQDEVIDTTIYDEIKFTGINPATSYSDAAGSWLIYLDPKKELPGKADSTYFEGLQILVDSKAAPLQVYKAAYQNTAMLVDYGVIPKQITKDTLIVIKAGKAKANDGSHGIELKKDYIIYANQYGWSTEGFIKEPSYKKVTFSDILEGTAYFETAASWLVYTTPSKELPGKADSTNFKGLKASIDGKEYEIVVYKAEYKNSALIAFEAALPKTITSNTKIVVKSGKAISNDGSDGIWLTKDFTIYANAYGWSTDGFMKKITASEKNVALTLDRDTLYGGDKKGIYLNTTDKFPVDTAWATKIYAASFDEKAGVFYNGEKINAPVVRYADGKAYIGLLDVGFEAKDKDKVTIKGMFVLGEYGVSYKEVSFYFNGKTWNTKYEKAKKATYTAIQAEKVNNVSKWQEEYKRWDVYLDVSAMLPGEIDKINFEGLTVQIGKKKVEVTTFHSFQDTLFFFIPEDVLPGNVKDGTAITLKNGKALAGDLTTGINLIKDFTFYVYRGGLTEKKPTNNTKWQKVEIFSMNSTTSYREEAKCWLIHLKLREPLATETHTQYLDFAIEVNGKEHKITAAQDGEFLMLTIPDTVLPENAKKGTITIKKGATGYANAGANGIKIKEDFTMHLYNGVISEREFTEVEEYETRILGVQNALEEEQRTHIYLRLNKEFPGTAWYEKYDDFVYYYNGKAIRYSASKSQSSNNKFMYFSIEKTEIPKCKDGDIILIKGGTVLTCGGYKVIITDDFQMMYSGGLWSQFVDSKIKAPKDTLSLWDVARFDAEYIPTTEAGEVLYSNEDTYNKISSIEKMKDFTISFNSKKIYDDETTPSFGVILRGNAISEDEPMNQTLLYGYVITFTALEVLDEEGNSTWTQYINLWKNGENYSLLDQYRISYVHDQSDHPYFCYEEDHNYEFSIYNITDTCVCITVKVDGKLAMRYYDEAGSDPFDPAINAGTFQVYAGCPNYVTDDICELSEVIAEADKCVVGDKVRVAATYPSVIEGAEFTIDKKGATITDGVFVATEVGTYTISCTYNGKELAPKTIVVEEAPELPSINTDKQDAAFPVFPVAVAGVVVLLGVAAIVILTVRKKKKVK